MTTVEPSSEVRRVNGEYRVELALRRRASELEAVFHALPDGVLVVDTAGQVVEANRAVVALLGFKRKEHVLGPLAQILRPRATRLDGSPLTRDELTGYQALCRGSVSRVEVRVEAAPTQHHDPTSACVLELVASPIHDDDGSILGAVVVTRDITLARRRAGHAAFLTEVTDLFASSHDVSAMLDTFAERCVAELADWCSIELYDDIGKVLRPAAARHRDPEAAGPLAAALERRPLRLGEGFAGSAARADAPLVLADLTDAVLSRYARGAPEAHLIRRLALRSVIAVPLRGNSGLVGVLSIGSTRARPELDAEHVDLLEKIARRIAIPLERGRRHDDLGKALGRLEAVLDSMAEGLVVFDEDGRIVLTNAVVRRLFELDHDPIGWSDTDFVRRTAACLERPEAADEIVRAIEADRASAQRGGRVLADDVSRIEFRLGRPDRRDIERAATPIRGAAFGAEQEDGEIIGWVALYRDLTHIREAERVKNEFASSVGRELQLPLTSISAYAAQGLRKARQVHADRSIVHGLEVVLRNARQLTVLVGDLLDAERVDVGGPDLILSQVDVLGLVAQAVDEARAMTTLHRLRVDAPISSPSARWDPDRVRQALINVLSNAIKYWPEGGQILVRVRIHNEGVLISVRDRGLGVPPDHLERVFERFYRILDGAERQRVRGRGLGLHLVRGVVRAHGGAVWAQSTGEPGQGTTVHILLPWIADE